MLLFFVDGFLLVFLLLALALCVVLVDVEFVDPVEPVCATARPAPSIIVTTNISSFFMHSPSENQILRKIVCVQGELLITG